MPRVCRWCWRRDWAMARTGSPMRRPQIEHGTEPDGSSVPQRLQNIWDLQASTFNDTQGSGGSSVKPGHGISSGKRRQFVYGRAAVARPLRWAFTPVALLSKTTTGPKGRRNVFDRYAALKRLCRNLGLAEGAKMGEEEVCRTKGRSSTVGPPFYGGIGASACPRPRLTSFAAWRLLKAPG